MIFTYTPLHLNNLVMKRIDLMNKLDKSMDPYCLWSLEKFVFYL